MVPFLKIKIILAGEGKIDEKGAEEEDRIVEARIQPSQIESYHQGFYWGTFIYLQGGQTLCTPLEIGEFEEKLTGYWSQLTNFHNSKSKILV